MVWVEHWVGRPFMTPPFPVIVVTLWAWLRMVPRATVSSRVRHWHPPGKLSSCLHLGYPVLSISHTCVPAEHISLAHPRSVFSHSGSFCPLHIHSFNSSFFWNLPVSSGPLKVLLLSINPVVHGWHAEFTSFILSRIPSVGLRGYKSIVRPREMLNLLVSISSPET